jgi:hypothetical protein
MTFFAYSRYILNKISKYSQDELLAPYINYNIYFKKLVAPFFFARRL